MAVEEIVVDETLQSRLGENGLREVMDQLWTEDCQTPTCGRPLGSGPPSLCVDVLADGKTIASLHHHSCRDPGWRVWPAPTVPSLAGVTHTWAVALFSTQVGEQLVLIPMLIINPSLERVLLRQETGGRWHVELPPEFVQAGLCTAADSGGITIGRPVAGAGIQFRGTATASLILGSYPDPRFELELDQDQVAAIRKLNGLLLVVSHVLHPSLIQNWAQVMSALQSERTIVGWVGIRSLATNARNRALAEITHAVSKDLDSQSGTSSESTYVLHFAPTEVTIGELLGQIEHDLDNDQARSWARNVLGDTAHRLFDWGRFGTGYITADPLSFEEFFLYKRDHGWQLVRALAHLVASQSNLSLPGNEDEARVWAAEVLKLKAGISAPSWRAESGGQSGSAITLYTSGASSG